MKDLFIHKRTLYAALGIVVVFCLGFAYPFLVVAGKLAFCVLVIALLIDAIRLFGIKNPVAGKRILENKLSNGDHNPVILQLNSRFPFATLWRVVEEFPFQLQVRNRDFRLDRLSAFEVREVSYEVKPVERGVYAFGDTHVFARTTLGLLTRRVTLPTRQEVKVYPSFIQYRKYAFLAISNRLEEAGVKKVRKLGISNEFEQIREYVQGDDYRVINWKATARKQELMVNQYQEEKAQNIYCLIDKGRLMHMPFEQLSLLDYSINAVLVMAGVAIGRDDKAGLITFSDKMGAFIPAQSKRTQMSRIADALYAQDVRQRESDFARLYKNIRVWIKKRSLLILFTNFDSLVSLERQMKYLKALSASHVLCTVIFDNSEINRWANTKAYSLEKAYRQTIAEKFYHDKRLIVRELNKNGIYTILTEPQQLTVNTINKYLQLKAQGLL